MDTIEIPLSQGKIAIIDATDWELVKDYKWCAHKSGNTYYAVTGIRKPDGKKILLQMHKLFVDTKLGFVTDHISGDGLDNRRLNLRTVTTAQNGMNRKSQSNCKNKFKGICWLPKRKKWYASIFVEGKHRYLGSFDSPEEGAVAYDTAAKEYFGEYACLNFP